MTIKVYGYAWYTNVSRVVITLFEKGVTDFEIVPIDVIKGEQKSPEYLEIQPFGKAPTLIDGDITLFESRAICRFLGHKFEGQGTALYGTTPKDKALVEQWLEVESQSFNPNITPIMAELVFAPALFGAPGDQAIVTTHLPKLESVLDVYEKQLSKSKYLAGDFFSLADLAHYPYLHYLIEVGKKGDLLLVDSRPRVKAWWKDISSRPSYKKWVSLSESERQKTGIIFKI